jgi:hypothetical protein
LKRNTFIVKIFQKSWRKVNIDGKYNLSESFGNNRVSSRGAKGISYGYCKATFNRRAQGPVGSEYQKGKGRI